jgi:WD40 repeat protein
MTAEFFNPRKNQRTLVASWYYGFQDSSALLVMNHYETSSMARSKKSANELRKVLMKSGDKVIPGLKLRCVCAGHTDTITLVSWSPDGKRLASSSRDKTVRVWNPKTGACLQLVPVKDGASSADWLPDGEDLALLDNEFYPIGKPGDPVRSGRYEYDHVFPLSLKLSLKENFKYRDIFIY